MALDHSLERLVVIRARRETVFRYFTDSARFAAWWGPGSTVDARPGGAVRIRYPNAVEATGEVLEVAAPERFVFTYGYVDPSKGVPPGGSRVTITLETVPEGTRLKLLHDLADSKSRDAHRSGWPYQLAVFATVVAAEEHADLAGKADAWFRGWAEPDGEKRRTLLREAAAPSIEFRDPYGCVSGMDDLERHIVQVQTFMPGLTLQREGDPRQCQGTALVDWVMRSPDGVKRGRGTNVVDLAPDGRFARVVGLAARPERSEVDGGKPSADQV
jgi:uncharacterized protein YndB with AHSA1/START domain